MSTTCCGDGVVSVPSAGTGRAGRQHLNMLGHKMSRKATIPWKFLQKKIPWKRRK